jgi:hypothetical protein
MKCISAVTNLQFQINLPFIVMLCEQFFFSFFVEINFIYEVGVLLHLLIHMNDDNDRLI